MTNAPRRFLHLYMPDIAANLIDKITNTSAGAGTLRWLLSKFGGNGGKRYASFLQIGKSKNQLEVFESLRQQYDDETLAFVALTMYMEKCGAGVSTSGFEGQLEEILTVKKQYPDRLLVFMGLDPRWQLSGTALRKTVESYFNKKISVTATRSVYPFAGLKLYPSMGFYVFDERLKETFEWAADNGVPVLSHCNYMGGIFNNDTTYLQANLNTYDVYTGKNYDKPVYIQQKHFWKRVLGTNSTNNNKNSCSYFLEPESYTSLLTYFDKRPNPLKLCMAHFGGGNQILASIGKKKDADELHPYGVKDLNWYLQVQQLLTAYKNLYADISYAVYDPAIFPPVFKDLNHPTYGERILFGTDFFMTERELPEKNIYGVFKKAALAEKLSAYNNITAWEQAAGKNTQRFLQSRYYDSVNVQD